MMRVLTIALLALLAGSASAQRWAPFMAAVPGGVVGDVPFALPTGSVLHFMSTTGSDANDGLAPTVGGGHGPWLTPSHNMKCGEVILVASGNYDPSAWSFGTVANCPSSSGGIDGLGQIYFAVLLCAGADLEACQVKQPSPVGGNGVLLSNSNWAVEGFKCNGNTGSNICFISDAQANNRIIHHQAFINNIAYDTAQGFGTNGCPGGCTHNIPGEGSDYVAFVGNIAQNANQAGICLGAMDIVGPGVFDQAAGTHNIMYGNFSFSNLIPGGCSFDGEGLYFDTWDAHGAAYQGVIANNITWKNERYGLGFTHSGDHLSFVSNILYHHNTTYAGCQGNYSADFMCGDVSWNGTFTVVIPYTGAFHSNIAQMTFTTMAGVGGNTPVYAMALTGQAPGITLGGTGTENILASAAGRSCSAGGGTLGTGHCSPGFVVGGNNCTPMPCGSIANDGNGLGNNIYTDPLYTNVSDLITNRSGVPNCTGFVNTTACMGWNATTRVLTTPSVISDLQASCAQCAGKGYQLPSTTCTPNAEYPNYLKGVVYLHAVNGFTAGTPIVQKADLVTRPCGM